MTDTPNQRILLVDDTPSIHEDFRKILSPGPDRGAQSLADSRAALFGDEDESAPESAATGFELESAYQGQEALERVVASLEEGRPFAMAFVDVRMPPGWDGIQTIRHLWEVDPELQVVICTAYSDYSWDQTIQELGQSEKLLILKKPFDSVEIRQLACAMTASWNSCRRERELLEAVQAREAQTQAYASSLETMNQALLTAKASSERSAESKTEFLVQLSREVGQQLSQILDQLVQNGCPAGLESAIDSGRDLMATLDRILDLTQLEDGEVPVQTAPFPLVAMVREVLAERRSDAERTGHSLEFRLAGPVPETVECDGARVRQVLDQLIDNALRHTSQGRIQVCLANEPTEDWSRTRVILTVEDEGQGITQEVQGRMYEPFIGRPGAGLGLAVSRELMKLMGGELIYEPAPSGGAHFRATLEVGNLAGVRMVEG